MEDRKQWLARSEKGCRVDPASRHVHAAPDNAYAVVSYEITSEPLTELPENKLPPDLAAQIDRLYHLVQSSSRATPSSS